MDSEIQGSQPVEAEGRSPPTVRITKQLLVALSRPPKGNRVTWDSEVTGFGVRITAAGSIAYVLRYVFQGQERRITIGKHPDLTPSAAREKAIIMRGAITDGFDPLVARVEAREAPTVADLCQDYLERHAKPKKRPTSISNDTSMIDRHIKPELGTKKVAFVTRREIDELHQGLKDTPYQANRLLALLSKMFSLAVSWGWRTDNPAQGIERFQEQKRHRWLSTDEIAKLARALEKHPNQRAANAIRLLLLTGARRGEVLSATWGQFDLKRRVWTKPSSHTKQKREEHVPLSAPALALVSKMKTDAIKSLGSEEALKEIPYLFPGDAEGKPVQHIKKAWASICKFAGIENARMHDLRHTYASHLASSGLSLPLIGRLLGHTQASTTQRYAHLADDPLRKATDSFGTMVEKLGKGKRSARVIQLRKRDGAA